MTFCQLTLNFDAHYHPQLDFSIELWQAEGINCCSFTVTNALDKTPGLQGTVLEPLPGETKLWDQCSAELIFIEPVNKRQLESKLRALGFPVTIGSWSHIEDKPWEREWLQYYQPLLIGKDAKHPFWVSPHNHQPPNDNFPVLWLDPGLAFGTGSHETTYLCLQWLASHSVNNKTILDYGCGSGILALAAIICGANFSYCIDIDPQSITATQDNAKRNQIEESRLLTTLDYNQLQGTKVDIVFANILFEPLKQLAPVLHQFCAPNALICLSGLINSQVNELITTYSPYFKDFVTQTKNDWVCISALKC